jgi:hypothetical protein
LPARRPFALALTAAAIALLALVPVSVSAASSVVECGQLAAYTAPDPLGPTDGSIQLGLSDTWTINADATLSANAATALPSGSGNGPTCLAMDLDGSGHVTSLDFSPTGSLSGHVAFDSGSGYYILASRLIVPTFVTDANPGLAALFVPSYQAGSVLTISFTVDTTNGGFTGFDGHAAFCGKGSVTSGGDGKVGKAVIPASVLDAADIKALKGAGSRKTCAAVHSVGTIDAQTGALSITTNVSITVAAAGATITPPPTYTDASAVAPAAGSSAPILAWLAVVFSVALALAVRHGRARSES